MKLRKIRYNGNNPTLKDQERTPREWANEFGASTRTIIKRANEGRPIDVDARVTPSPFMDGS